MSELKVLIVGRTFFPVQSPRSFRTTELCKELARQGHHVDVLLPQNLQAEIEARFVNSYGIRFLFYGPLRWDKFKKLKFRWIGDWKRKFDRLLFLLFEFPNIEIFFKLPKKLKKLDGYDLMISIAVPHENHWAIARLRSSKNQIAKTWVADCGDPFMTNVLETIPPPFYFGRLEKKFLKKADFVSVPATGSINAYDSSYHNKFRVIPQGFNFNEVEITDNKPVYPFPTFAYAGGVSKTGIRSLHAFIEVLKRHSGSFCFNVYSAAGREVLGPEIKSYEDKIVLHNPLPRKELLYKLSEMDFLVNLDNGTHLNTPSKLIDYALAQRPVLNVDPMKPDVNLIAAFLNGDYSDAKRVDDLESYNITKVAQQFIELTKK